ncbi:MAG: DUF4115 domain-containing protein [Gammaproteobacteria bacterium]
MSDSQEQEKLEEKVESEKEAREVTELPGRRLRETRESKHLSRDEVANHLRLDVQLIIALEEDQYSNLPSPAYICGYLRSYARLLKLPEDEIVQAYNHGEQINSDLIPSSVQITPLKPPVNTAFIKVILVLIITAVIVGGGYYLIDKYHVFSKTGILGSDKGVQHSSELVIPPAPKSVTETLNTSKSVDAKKPPPNQTASEEKPASKPATPPAELKSGIAKVEKLPTPKARIPASEPVGSSGQSQTKTGAPANANSADAQATAPGSSSQANNVTAATSMLRMHFTDNSWVEVTDSTNDRLVYRLVEKDTDLKVQGVPPFTILLGNAPGVQVFYKGKEFDHSNYHRNQVASFRVGEK